MPNLLEKLRALAETEKQATAGPWSVVDYRHGDKSQETWLGILNGAIEIKYSALPTEENHANAVLIADSRTLLKALIESWFAQHEALKLMVNGTHCDDHCEECQDDGVKCIHEVAREALNLATTPHR